MIANYKGATYLADLVGNKVILLTNDKEKANKDFDLKGDYFKKTTTIDDPELTDLFIQHFCVYYSDPIEGTKWWKADKEPPSRLEWNIEDDQVVINVPHNAKDTTWIQYNEESAAKKVNLDDCNGFLVKKTYVKHNGELIELTEECYMSIEDFKEALKSG